MKNIGDSVDVPITRTESNFDKACDAAHQFALMHFEIDEDGHSRRVRDWERSCCWIEVSFEGYIRMGNEHHYKFRATTAKSDD